ncbi:MAG: hypothetical protein HQL63_15145 [Magnetococcales bacterium]|nr:hypothetical protein [Magnetococcales bacterium]
MAMFKPRRFAQPETLKAIEPGRLARFLTPHAEFLASRGVNLSSNDDGVDCDLLASVLMNLGEDAPLNLLESLYIIHEMASQDGMDRLLEAAEENNLAIDFEPDSSPADIAIQFFLNNRELLEQQHAKLFVTRVRSFLYFQGNPAWKGSFVLPNDATLQALESDLDEWFDKKKRGRGCRVFLFDQGQRVNLVVRHGMPFRREGSMEKDGQPGAIYFRPESHDLLIYDREANELCVRACSKGERSMYLPHIGRHLFGNEEHFNGDEKYTLDPLLTDMADSLVHSDIDGIEWIRLLAVNIYWGGEHGESETRRARDLLAAFQQRAYSLPKSARLSEARFQIKFTASRAPRTLVIRPNNQAMYTRDDDSLILETWMKRRGFDRTSAIANEEEYAEYAAVVGDVGSGAGEFGDHGGLAAASAG